MVGYRGSLFPAKLLGDANELPRLARPEAVSGPTIFSGWRAEAWRFPALVAVRPFLAQMPAHVHIYIYLYMYVCMYVYLYISMYICIYGCMV